MRVVLGLLLLACCGGLVSSQVTINPDATNTFHITAATGIDSYTIGGQPNPTLNMTIGTTYYLSIEFASSSHPFGLNTDKASTTVAENGLVVNGTCGGTATAGYTTASSTVPFCVLAFTAPNTTTPLFYHCAFHPNMVGAIQLNAAAAPASNTTNPTPTATPTPTSAPANNTTNGTTTAPPTTTTAPPTTTTAPPTTPAPANTVNPDATNTFHVTGAAANNAGWIFTSGGAQFTNPTLNMAAGKTYTISIEFPTPNHPFGLSTSATGTAVADLGLVNAVNSTTTCGGSATTGYTSTTTCTLTFTPPANTPQPLYYHCAFHKDMVGQIVVTGKNSGFALVPGFAALFAVVAALFAQ